MVGGMRAPHYLAVVTFILAMIAGGCSEQSMPRGPQSTPREPIRLHRPRAATTPMAWCGTPAAAPYMVYHKHNKARSKKRPRSGTIPDITVNCILDNGAQGAVTISVPVDEESGDTQDSCGQVNWTTPPPDGITSITMTDNTGAGTCARQDSVQLVVQRPSKSSASPSPGALVAPGYAFQGSDYECCVETNIETPSFTVYVYAPPALQILDNDAIGTPIISSPAPTPSPLMIGQQLGLLGQVVGGMAVTAPSAEWSPDTVATSDVVASYDVVSTAPPPSVGAPEPLGPSGETLVATIGSAGTSGSPLTLYYLKPGTHEIDLDATVQLVSSGTAIGPAMPLTAATTYSIEGPKSQTTTQTIGSGAQGTQIQTGPWPSPLPSGSICTIGTECIIGGYPAATWAYQVTMPSIGGGLIGVVQLISDKLSFQGTHGAPRNFCTSTMMSLQNPQYWLDNFFPAYPAVQTTAPWNGNDGPTLPFLYAITDQTADTGDIASWRTAFFRDYWMYQPTPSASRPSIWVTLAYSSWNFADSWTANYNSKREFTNFSEGMPVAKVNVNGIAPNASSALPTWPAVLSNRNGPSTCS